MAVVVTGTVNVDITKPTSKMTSLPAISLSPIQLSWSGSDALSGVSAFDLQVRAGIGSTWTDVLSNATNISTSYSCAYGITYYFRVRARDVAGNVGDWSADTYTLVKGSQTINFAPLTSKTFGDPPFTVSATGGASGNPVTFVAAQSAVCRSSGTNGSSITIAGAGNCTVTASQAGNTIYNAAPDAAQTFTVGKGNQAITFGPLPAKIYGDPPFALVASGGNSGNPVTFVSSPLTVCSALGTNGSTMILTGPGTCSVTASQAGNANYNPAPDVLRSITVNPPAPLPPFSATLPLPLAVGTAAPCYYIADITLAPGGRTGSYGIEILAKRGRRKLSGGINFGGAIAENGQRESFAAFNTLNDRGADQIVHLDLNAQALPTAGRNPTNLGLRVQFLDSNKVAASSVFLTSPTGTPGIHRLVADVVLKAGFYSINLQSVAGSPMGTFQLSATTRYTDGSAAEFDSGAVVGGYLTLEANGNSLAGFAGFCLGEDQEIQITLLHYDGIGPLVLRVKDSDQRVVYDSRNR